MLTSGPSPRGEVERSNKPGWRDRVPRRGRLEAVPDGAKFGGYGADCQRPFHGTPGASEFKEIAEVDPDAGAGSLALPLDGDVLGADEDVRVVPV